MSARCRVRRIGAAIGSCPWRWSFGATVPSGCTIASSSPARRQRPLGPKTASTLNACFKLNRGAFHLGGSPLRAFDMALTALALSVSPALAPKRQRRLIPAVGEAGAAALDRDALSRQRTAIIASLWPRGGQCILPACYLQLPAPALLGPA